MSVKENFLTPAGRIVMGDLYTANDKDADGNLRVVKEGPRKGEPQPQFFFALAIPKKGETHWANAPGPITDKTPHAWGQALWRAGHGSFPSSASTPAFAWKVVDGDSMIPNKKGKKPAEREGYPGHWVLSFTSSYAFKVVNSNGSEQWPEKDRVKPGHWVQVFGDARGNDSGQSPGIFLNGSLVAFQAFDKEIISGPDASAVGFGTGVTLPAGASAVPLGGMAPPVPAAAASPTAHLNPPVPGAPTVAAQPTIIPDPTFLNAAGAVPVPPAPPAVAAGPVMTAKAGPAKYADFVAKGWTDAMLREQGFIV